MSKLTQLENEYKQKRRELKKEEEIRAKFQNKGIEINHILGLDSYLKEKPTITIEIKSLSEISKIMKHFKPIPLWYIDNTTTSNLKKFEKREITMQDNRVLNEVEYQTERNHFFKIDNDYFIDFENYGHYGHNEKKVKLRYQSKEFYLWVEFKQDLINSKYLDFTEEIDTHETEQARQYNERYKEITKINHFLKETEGIKKINFYGGSKECFSINKKGSNHINKVLGVGK